MKSTPRRQRGMSLLTLAIWMTGLGFALAVLVAIFPNRADEQRIDQSISTVKTAQEQLLGHVIREFRLPRPDTTTPADGSENPGATRGALPWRDMGLPAPVLDSASTPLVYAPYTNGGANADLTDPGNLFIPDLPDLSGFTGDQDPNTEGESVKVVFTDSSRQMMAAGTWLVSRDGGETVYLVNPREKTYMDWNIGDVMGRLGDRMAALKGTFEVSFENPDMELVSEEAGPEVLGYDTVSSTFETSYTIELTIMGITQQVETVTRQQFWTTDAIEVPADGIWLKDGPPKTGIDRLDELIEQEMTMMASGRFPLKTEVVSTTTSQGLSSTTTSTTEVTAIDERDIDESVFRIPDDYERVEMPGIEKLMRQNQQQ